ncbi:MAG TPA: dihydrolipoamide acetyltransferase family protein [Gaiellales bacterium]
MSAVEIVMPRLSDAMEQGTIVRWLKGVGDEVAVGDELVEVETDKATVIYEAEIAGTLSAILVQEGEAQALGGPIATIGGEPVTAAAGGASAAPVVPQAAAAAPAPVATNGAGAPPRPPATPVARRRARELGVELGSLTGTGPRGRIRLADVEGAASAAPAAAPATAPATAAAADDGGRGSAERIPLTSIQRTIAQRMAETVATVPHYRLSADVDFGEVLRLRDRLRAAVGDAAPTVNDIVVALTGRALAEHPGINCSYAGDAVVRHGRVNVGIAVARPGALLVPVVHDADSRSLGEIARASAALIERVRTSSSTPADLAGGTFTVSNLGMYGIASFDSIVNAPEAAILSVGAAQPRALVDESGAVASRSYATLTLACDHRAIYGADAAAFLARLRTLLESPEVLVL